jgi:hypothetical protein
MALNTAPLTTTRRLVMLGVLFGLFLASLALAAGLVRLAEQRGGGGATSLHGISYDYAPLPGFQEDTSDTPAVHDAVIALRGRVGAAGTMGSPRLFYVFRLSNVPSAYQGTLRDVANVLCRNYLGVDGGIDETTQYTPAMLGGKSAVEAAVRLTDSGAFARLRVARFNDQYVAVLYVGSTGMTPQDVALWKQVTGSFKVHGLGSERP